jgi:hypothetical protein
VSDQHAVVDAARRAMARGPAALLIRHAERGPIPDPTLGHDVPLTDKGREDARALGRQLARHARVRARHSPVPRCAETARLIVDGTLEAGGEGELLGPHDALGGVYMVRPREALLAARDLGAAFLRHWFDGDLRPGLVVPRARAARLVLASANEGVRHGPGDLVVSVTHDWNLLAAREEFFGLRHEEAGWIGYLDGIALGQAGDEIVLVYGSHERRVRAEPDLGGTAAGSGS